jgi:hypothetical protein
LMNYSTSWIMGYFVRCVKEWFLENYNKYKTLITYYIRN